MFTNPFAAPAIAPARLRQEIFSLGGRHRGEPLAGALLELREPDLGPGRKALLRAVVLHLGSAPPSGAASPPPRGLAAFIGAHGARLAVLLAATACLVVVGIGLLAGP